MSEPTPIVSIDTPKAGDPPVRPSASVLLILAAILIFGGLLRMAWLGEKAYGLDEFLTAVVSTGRGSEYLAMPTDVVLDPAPGTTHLAGAPPWYRVWSTMTLITHPPLYYVVLRFWREVFGEGDIASRLLSVAASLAAILLLFDLGRQLFGSGPALWACLIMAVAQPQIESARQTRNYAFLLAMGLAACDVMVRIEKKGTGLRRIALFVPLLLATALTHYFALGALLAMLAYALVRLRGRTRWHALAAFGVAGAVGLAIWGPFFWQQRAIFSVNDPTVAFLVDRAPGHSLRTLIHFAALPLRFLIELASLHWLLAALAGLLYVLPAAALRRRPELLLPCLWVSGTVGVIAMMDLARSTTQLEYIRYTLLASPGVYLILAGLFWKAGGIVQHVLPALAVGVCLAWLPSVYVNESQPWQDLSQALDSKATPGDLLVFAAPQSPLWHATYLYMGYSHYSASNAHPVLILSGPASPDLLASLRSRRRIWLVAVPSQIPLAQLLGGYDAQEITAGEFHAAKVWKMMPRDAAPPTLP